MEEREFDPHIQSKKSKYTSFKPKSHNDLDLIIKNIKTEWFSVTKICMRYCRSIIKSIPVESYVGGSYVLALYRATLIDPLNQTKILPRCLFEILIEYVEFDQNHAIIIYEENSEEIQCYKVYNKSFNS